MQLTPSTGAYYIFSSLHQQYSNNSQVRLYAYRYLAESWVCTWGWDGAGFLGIMRESRTYRAYPCRIYSPRWRRRGRLASSCHAWPVYLVRFLYTDCGGGSPYTWLGGLDQQCAQQLGSCIGRTPPLYRNPYLRIGSHLLCGMKFLMHVNAIFLSIL